MQTINRNHSVFSGEDDLEPLHCFKKFPIFMGCVDVPQETDLLADMEWHISRNSGSIQLNPLIPLDILYKESHGAGCVGQLWDLHHQEFAAFISRYKPAAVLEIGGAHGILAAKYQSSHDITWAILEPNPSPTEGCKAEYIKGFFDDHFVLDDRFDTVVHSHVFEHIYEPREFMRQLANSMGLGQRLIFSVPNMQVMLQRKYTNCINFEHTFLLTEQHIEYLLANNGFRVVDKHYFMADHSIFYSAVRDSAVEPRDLPADVYEHNKKLYLDYVAYHEALIRDINSRILSTDNPVYLFGAHVFAQYLLAFGLDSSKIICLLDNDVKKHGKRLYGTNLQVQSPKILSNDSNPVIILKAGVYNEEIKRDILENINPGALFFE